VPVHGYGGKNHQTEGGDDKFSRAEKHHARGIVGGIRGNGKIAVEKSYDSEDQNPGQTNSGSGLAKLNNGFQRMLDCL
jgi:hypothetical protein